MRPVIRMQPNVSKTLGTKSLCVGSHRVYPKGGLHFLVLKVDRGLRTRSRNPGAYLARRRPEADVHLWHGCNAKSSMMLALVCACTIPYPAQAMPKSIAETFYRLAAGGAVPRALFAPRLPPRTRPVADSNPERPLRLELVSHCWRYAPHLTYQLSSLILHPPKTVEVKMTVFYCPEDKDTVQLLDWVGQRDVPHVSWNWQPLERGRLFRRGIGRNLAALATEADWIWFADCDVVFHEGALDSLDETLRGRNDYMVFPRRHNITEMLEEDDPVFQAAHGEAIAEQRPLDIDAVNFTEEERDKAVGAFQIVRGDVARAVGYCRDIKYYQKPLERWQKTYEDRTFRWLLGTHGTPIDIPGIYRIRHIKKGRKQDA